MAEERKAKKTSILDLSKYVDKAIRVKFSGGREGLYVTLNLLYKPLEKELIPDFCEIASGTSVSELFGIQVAGVLKGFDHLLNIVLDNCTEFLRDPEDPYKLSDETRTLGIVVCRGTAVVLICPVDGMEAIANPFLQQEA